MSNKRYIYNPQTDTFTEIKSMPFKKTVKWIGVITSSFIGAFCLYFLFSYYLPSPKEILLNRDLERLSTQYTKLNDQLLTINSVLDNIKARDGEVYELMLGAKPIDDNIWQGGIGGHDIQGEYIADDVSLDALRNKMNEVERKLVLHSKYLEEVEDAAVHRDNQQRSIPSIKPVRLDQKDAYLRLLSGYGMRMHPIYKVNKMHMGLDFPSPKGTPVIATGDGVVVKVRKDRGGYGRHIVIDHGYGYESLYAHLDKSQVREGQQVVRGEKIGEVGRTGTATATHLHYEVRQNHVPVNPINYCMDGLSPIEFERLVIAASQHNCSFD